MDMQYKISYTQAVDCCGMQLKFEFEVFLENRDYQIGYFLSLCVCVCGCMYVSVRHIIDA